MSAMIDSMHDLEATQNAVHDGIRTDLRRYTTIEARG